MIKDKKLLSILKDQEADAVSFYSSELAHKQTEAMERYNVEPYGDEVTGRSQVLTQDVADTMDWTLSSFRKVFMNSVDLVALEAAREEDEAHIEAAANYLQHVLFKDNDGKNFIRTFAFDGLLQKLGVASITWMDGEKEPAKQLEGVLDEQLERYVLDPEYEITGQEENEEEVDGQPVRTWDLEVVRTPKGRCVIENVPPENFLVSRRAKTLDAADYRGKHSEEFLADLKRRFPKRAQALDPLNSAGSGDDLDREGDPRREERFTDEPEDTFDQENSDEHREKVTLHCEYIRVDRDEDGVTELVHVKRVGNTILEAMAVDDCEFAVWTPIPVAHRLIGKSLAERVIDIQKVRTVTTRNALDNLALSVRPRNVVNIQLVPEEWHDVLLDHQIGGIIPAMGDSNSAVTPLVVPDMTNSAFKMLEYHEDLKEKQTGITRHSQGLDPETLTQTKGGIAMQQDAGNERKEDYASLLAIGLEMVLTKVLKILCAYQDHARVVKIGKKWAKFDPRTWSDDMTVTVHVGQGTGTRQTQIGNLMGIAAKQELLLQADPNNGIVTLNEYRNTLVRLAEAMGFRDATQFFKELPEQDPNAPPEPEQPSPEMIEAQSKAQLEQQKTKAAIDLKMFQAKEAARLDEMRLVGQLANEEKRITGELEIQERQRAAELDLKERTIKEEQRIARETGQEASVSEVHVGGDAG